MTKIYYILKTTYNSNSGWYQSSVVAMSPNKSSMDKWCDILTNKEEEENKRKDELESAMEVTREVYYQNYGVNDGGTIEELNAALEKADDAMEKDIEYHKLRNELVYGHKRYERSEYTVLSFDAALSGNLYMNEAEGVGTAMPLGDMYDRF